MTLFKTTAVVLLVLATAACTNPDRFGAGRDGGAGAGANAGMGVGMAGSASDPTSPLFFNQTIGDRVLFAVDSSAITPAGQCVSG